MLTETSDYEKLTRDFRWEVPARFNMATACCDRHADGSGRLALIYVDEDGGTQRLTFDEMSALSCRFANVLQADGLKRGDRVAVFLSQSLELPIVHLAAFRSGLVSVPLFTLFGEDALEFRLADSGARAIVTDESGWEKLAKIRERLPYLQDIYVTSGAVHAGAKPFWPSIEAASEQFATIDTAADDPAIIIYTSGTTGNPKGALHAHRVLLGHLPNVEMAHDFFPKPGDLMWTPADWAWIGGLFDALFPAWYHGVAMLGHRAKKFDALAAMQLMADHGVRNVFLPPTALKLMRQADVSHDGVKLRSIFSGGESLGGELLDWVRKIFGIDAHEIYGQTECNLVVGNNAKLFPIRPGSMGKATPGFDVCIVNERGEPQKRGERGIIGVRQPNPCTMIEYWKPPRRNMPVDFCSPATSASRMTTAISGTSAARTTSSPAPAIALARRRSNTRCSSTRRWRSPRWSAFPTRSAPRRSRPGSCCGRALRRATSWRARSRISSRCSSPRMNTRATSSSRRACR
jgi:acetyl-CoA synthetase